jgi:hypothetical protein
MTLVIPTAVLSLATAAFAQNATLWREPGRIERLDLYGGAGGRAGAPRAPFTYLSEDSSGSTPKILVRDARGRRWTVKWGEEVKAETFASRIAWAAGYYVEPTYYVRSGVIRGARDSGRAGKHLDKAGRFKDARFEYRDPSAKYLPTLDWTWEKNPFVDSRALNGLKIVMMLVSNWDNKDGRDATSNTAILQRTAGSGREWTYLVTDWGATMGKWGNFFTRSKWDCDDFAKQSRDFVKGVDGREVEFGFSGQHDREFKDDITVADARWIGGYLNRLRSDQIVSALRAAGASPHEQACFTRALRSRIVQLNSIAAAGQGYRARRR